MLQPDATGATVEVNPSAPATPTTTFDPTAGWTTTLNPSDLSDEVFFVGQALPVDSNLTGGGKATLSFTTQSTVNSVAFNWQWSAAAYSRARLVLLHFPR